MRSSIYVPGSSHTKKNNFLNLFSLLITQNHVILYIKLKQKQNTPSRRSSPPLYASLVHQFSLLGYVLFNLYLSFLFFFWFKLANYFVYLKIEFSLRVIYFNFSWLSN